MMPSCGEAPRAERDLRTEREVAVAGKNRDGDSLGADHKVAFAVAIEVGAQGKGHIGCRRDRARRRERRIAVAREDGDVRVVAIGHDQIGFAVAVEVANPEDVADVTGDVGRCEVAGAIAQQHDDAASAATPGR